MKRSGKTKWQAKNKKKLTQKKEFRGGKLTYVDGMHYLAHLIMAIKNG